MTNISIEPGHDTLDEMIATAADGILVDMNKSLSIDDRRLSFRFGVEMGWEIKNGRLGRMLKNCTTQASRLSSGLAVTLWATGRTSASTAFLPATRASLCR